MFVPLLYPGTLRASDNGIRNASDFRGADWAASVSMAIAALPREGGSVFVPSDLQGLASTSIMIPSNVALRFDVGTFRTSESITFTGENSAIEGSATSATVLSFTAATEGIVFADVTNYGVQHDRVVNLTLNAENVSALSAIHATSTVPSANTHHSFENLVIRASGTGHWQYGMFFSNAQHMSGYAITISGAAIGLHADTSTNENHFYNLRVQGNGFRGVEVVPPDPNSQEFWFDGGSIEGTFSGSAIFASVGEIHISGMHIENVVSDPVDGADVVLSGPIILHAVNTQLQRLVTQGSGRNAPIVFISSSEITRATLSPGTSGLIEGCNIGAIADESTRDYSAGGYLAFLANRSTSGSMLPNKNIGYYTSAEVRSIPPFIRSLDSDVNISALTLDNSTRLMSLNGTRNGILSLIWADSANNTNLCTSGHLNIGLGGASVNCIDGTFTSPVTTQTANAAPIHLTAQTVPLTPRPFYTNRTGKDILVRVTVAAKLTAAGAGKSWNVGAGVTGNAAVCMGHDTQFSSLAAADTSSCSFISILPPASSAFYSTMFKSMTANPTYELWAIIERLE
jgi:hypothetical protein